MFVECVRSNGAIYFMIVNQLLLMISYKYWSYVYKLLILSPMDEGNVCVAFYSSETN